MQQKKILYQVDNFRMIAALLVVAIHVSPLENINMKADFFLTRVIARVGVPFFFMITGYFLLAPCFLAGGTRDMKVTDQKNRIRIKSNLVKLVKIYLGAILLYLPLNIYTGYFYNGFTIGNLIKDILVNGTFYHLWYLPAAIFSLWFLYHLSRRYSMNRILCVTGVLYLVGLLGDSYYGLISRIPIFREAYDLMFRCFDYTRNGLFYAPIFMMLGVIIAKKVSNNSNNRPSQKSENIIYFVMCGIIMCFEAFFLEVKGYPRHDSMYLMLIPVMYYLFLVLVEGSQKQKTPLFPKELSLLIYILHPLVIVIIRGVSKTIGVEKIFVENQLNLYLLTCAISFGMAWVMRLLPKMKNIILKRV